MNEENKMSKDSCSICELISNEKNLIFSDRKAAIYLYPYPAVKGHIAISPREHYTILEQVPDDIISYLFILSNVVSVSVFQSFQCEGTNIIIQNGEAAGQSKAHFVINVIPRKKNDGLNFDFKRYKATKEELSDVQQLLSEGVKRFLQKPKKPVDLNRMNKPQRIIVEKSDDSSAFDESNSAEQGGDNDSDNSKSNEGSNNANRNNNSNNSETNGRGTDENNDDNSHSSGNSGSGNGGNSSNTDNGNNKGDKNKGEGKGSNSNKSDNSNKNSIKVIEKKENYLVKHLTRLP